MAGSSAITTPGAVLIEARNAAVGDRGVDQRDRRRARRSRPHPTDPRGRRRRPAHLGLTAAPPRHGIGVTPGERLGRERRRARGIRSSPPSHSPRRRERARSRSDERCSRPSRSSRLIRVSPSIPPMSACRRIRPSTLRASRPTGWPPFSCATSPRAHSPEAPRSPAPATCSCAPPPATRPWRTVPTAGRWCRHLPTTTAEVEPGAPLALAGDLTMTATQDAVARATGTGAALVLGVHEVGVALDRTATVGGSVTLAAIGRSDTAASAAPATLAVAGAAAAVQLLAALGGALGARRRCRRGRHPGARGRRHGRARAGDHRARRRTRRRLPVARGRQGRSLRGHDRLELRRRARSGSRDRSGAGAAARLASSVSST